MTARDPFDLRTTAGQASLGDNASAAFAEVAAGTLLDHGVVGRSLAILAGRRLAFDASSAQLEP